MRELFDSLYYLVAFSLGITGILYAICGFILNETFPFIGLFTSIFMFAVRWLITEKTIEDIPSSLPKDTASIGVFIFISFFFWISILD